MLLTFFKFYGQYLIEPHPPSNLFLAKNHGIYSSHAGFG
ncbi:Hypothetical protein HPV225_0425 [Helicobacter pylori v225d]|nr:Hypothetical protein HPV225_0425 [Helicobacter pylori v225d]